MVPFLSMFVRDIKFYILLQFYHQVWHKHTTIVGVKKRDK